MNVEELDAYMKFLVNARNGKIQKYFKDNLIMEFNQTCALCNIHHIRLLLASHILPYSKCKNKNDMANHYNGLLLCPIHDALFDKKFISFMPDGKILISEALNKADYKMYQISKNTRLPKRFLNKERLLFLNQHRELFNKMEKERSK